MAHLADEALFAQKTPEAPTTSRGETSVLPVCCMCGLIRDETGASLDPERWVTQRTYHKTHGLNPADCHLTHTYCPGCFTEFMGRIKAA